MKLLLDENLSPRLVDVFAAGFPGTTHIELLGLRGSTDSAIWDLARDQGYVIVSKDADFRQRSFLYGAPPKVIWLSVGNAGTDLIASLLLKNRDRISRFLAQPVTGLLVLRAAPSDSA